MRRFQLAAAAAVSSQTLGCATIDAYPICYYQAMPSGAELVELREDRSRAARAYLGPGSEVSFVARDRWMLAKGQPADHRSLRRIWPRLGCVGRYASALTYVYYSMCLDYLADMMRSRDYMLRGDRAEFPGQVTGYCNGSASAARRRETGTEPIAQARQPS